MFFRVRNIFAAAWETLPNHAPIPNQQNNRVKVGTNTTLFGQCVCVGSCCCPISTQTKQPHLIRAIGAFAIGGRRSRFSASITTHTNNTNSSRHIQEGLDSQDNYLPPFVCLPAWDRSVLLGMRLNRLQVTSSWYKQHSEWKFHLRVPSYSNAGSPCSRHALYPPPLPRHFSRRAIAFWHTSALENSIMHAGERCLSRDVMRTEFDLHVLLQTIYFQCNRVSSMLWSSHWIVWLLYLATEQNLNSALEMN